MGQMNESAPMRVAIVGPGRLGSALGRRWRDAGLDFLGFHGRDAASVDTALAFAGGGVSLAVADLRDADAVLLAVQDDRLVEVVGRLAAALGRVDSPAVWLHASGSRDLAVLQPLRDLGLRVAALHPICPIPDPAIGFENLPGQPAVLLVPEGDATALAVLQHLAAAAGLQAEVTHGGDRLVYHAACVLAANGLTALYSAVEELLHRALPDLDGHDIAPALMQSALDCCRRSGPESALSGPVLRGDADLLARQLARLAEAPASGPGHDPAVAQIYRSLMQRAAEIARQRGALRGESLERVRRALSVDA